MSRHFKEALPLPSVPRSKVENCTLNRKYGAVIRELSGINILFPPRTTLPAACLSVVRNSPAGGAQRFQREASQHRHSTRFASRLVKCCTKRGLQALVRKRSGKFNTVPCERTTFGSFFEFERRSSCTL
jgi:hypothetical protein